MFGMVLGACRFRFGISPSYIESRGWGSVSSTFIILVCKKVVSIKEEILVAIAPIAMGMAVFISKPAVCFIVFGLGAASSCSFVMPSPRRL